MKCQKTSEISKIERNLLNKFFKNRFIKIERTGSFTAVGWSIVQKSIEITNKI